MLVTSLALQQVKEIKVEDVENVNYMCECTAQFYIILALSITMISLIIFTILQLRRVNYVEDNYFQI